MTDSLSPSEHTLFINERISLVESDLQQCYDMLHGRTDHRVPEKQLMERIAALQMQLRNLNAQKSQTHEDPTVS